MGTCSGVDDEDLFSEDVSRLSALTSNRGGTQVEYRYGSPIINVVETAGRLQNPTNASQSNDILKKILEAIERIERSINTMVKFLKPARKRNAVKPTGFPLHSVGDIRSFEEVDDEEYIAVKVDRATVAGAMRRALRCGKKRLRKSRMAAATNNQNPQMETDDDEEES
ncbi:hypothetical protein PV327_008072 [Microctonus hyperodae]|uniref:Uncharacterized protein n=1 Tax=Microctonus hyperodae TaxID=165561 RepID=A0AA39F2C6_MICHY|nr:hypothetical protein PV327_008072 [Microctonus hyperodae]